MPIGGDWSSFFKLRVTRRESNTLIKSPIRWESPRTRDVGFARPQGVVLAEE